MPQFDFSVALPQIVWLILTFGLLLVLMRSLLPRVEQVAEARARVIGDDLGAAEAARLEAARVDAEYLAGLAGARSEATGFVGQAKAAGTRETEAMLKIAGGEVDARIEAAEARIAGLRAEAMGKLDAVAADAAADIVERLIGSRPSAAEAASAVAAAAA